MSAVQYFIRIRGNVQGPYVEEQLQSLVRRGQFSRIHEISNDGHNWVRAEEFPHLFVSVTPAANWRAEPDAPVEQPVLEEADVVMVVPPKLPNNDWYYIRNNEQCGPFGIESLRSRLAAGQMGADDLVWTEGMVDWEPASKVEALRPRVTLRPVDRTLRPRTSSLAISSFVAALLWLGGLGSLVAVILGGLALQQIKDSDGRLTGTGLAATGLVIGACCLVVTVIVGIGVAMMAF